MKKQEKSIYNNCSFMSVSGSNNSIIQGSQGASISTMDDLNEMEREAIRIMRAITMRQRVELLNIGYSIEDRRKANGGEGHGKEE